MWKPAVGIVAVLGAACTHWEQRTVYGQQTEVSRSLIGEPQVVESSSASVDAGLAGAGGDGIFAAGLSGNKETVKRTHCMQQAEIQYTQPYQLIATPSGRVSDWAGSVALAFVGLGVLVGTSASQHSVFSPGDPLYEPPPNPAGGYLIGGALVLGGASWIGYSYHALPHHPAPAVQASSRQWSETKLVEASGCGLVPTDAPAKPAGDTEQRLRELDKLHDAGVITEQEYQQKRKALIDSI